MPLSEQKSNLSKVKIMQTTTKNLLKNRVAPFAEIWECSNTQNKSLHTTIELEDGQIIAKRTKIIPFSTFQTPSKSFKTPEPIPHFKILH